jgi:cytochrome c peroxidase
MLRTRFNGQTVASPVLRRIVATAALLGAAVAPCHSDAIMGDVRKVDIPKAERVSNTDMRASYKRPRTIPFPADNPYTVQKAILGRKLYFDSRLSQGKLLSCASCHSPGYAWADGQPTGVGHAMKRLGRLSPEIMR